MKKTLIFLILIIACKYLPAQEVIEKTDKFTNIKTIKLDKLLKLNESDEGVGERVFINIFKIIDSKDTVFSFFVNGQGTRASYCTEGLKAILLLDDTIKINLLSNYGNVEPGSGMLMWNYYLSYALTKEEIISMYKAKKIEMKCYLTENFIQAEFTKENKKDLNFYIKKYLIKDL